MIKPLVKNARILFGKSLIVSGLHFTAVCMVLLALPACRQEIASGRSMLERWAQKEVLQAKLLEEGEWRSREGIATIKSVPDPRWGKVLRYHSPLLNSAHIQAPENRTPWGSFLAEQGGENNVALEFDKPQDWRAYNRIAVWVYIHPSKNPNVNLAFDLVNEGTKDTKLTPGRETYLDLPQGSWQQVLWEFDYYPRDRITRFELHQTLIGYDREIGEPEVTVDVGPMELQRVVPDHYEGWDLPEGQLAFSHVGYRPADAKQAIAAAGGSRFYLENERGKTVFKGSVRAFSNKGNDFALLDFSDFCKPGYYRIRYGESLSEPFPIGDDVWQEPFMSTLNFYFSQRCGYPVPGIHSACHLDTRGFSGDQTHSVTGGWHDAGDLSQGWFRTADACYALLTAYDCADQSLKPRIKDEIAWGLKWLREARFPEGCHVSWNHQRIYSDNQPGTMDDVVSQAGFSAWENYQGIAVFLKAADLFTDRKDELEAMALEDWKASVGYPVEDPLTLSWGVTASALLYEHFGKAQYKETALEYARRLLFGQQEGYWPALQGSHTAFNEAPMIALRSLCRLFPEEPEKADWLQSAALYCDYLKQGSRLSAPYNLLPAGGDRTFPIWENHIFHGASNIQLSAAWALAEAATFLNDADAMQLVQQQLEWTLGRNPFGSSLMYGVGYNYAPLFAYCSHNVVGALPVGVDSFHDDEPFWNGSACATSHEMWIEPVSRFVGALALFSTFTKTNSRL